MTWPNSTLVPWTPPLNLIHYSSRDKRFGLAYRYKKKYHKAEVTRMYFKALTSPALYSVSLTMRIQIQISFCIKRLKLVPVVPNSLNFVWMKGNLVWHGFVILANLFVWMEMNWNLILHLGLEDELAKTEKWTFEQFNWINHSKYVFL